MCANFIRCQITIDFKKIISGHILKFVVNDVKKTSYFSLCNNYSNYVIG